MGGHSGIGAGGGGEPQIGGSLANPYPLSEAYCAMHSATVCWPVGLMSPPEQALNARCNTSAADRIDGVCMSLNDVGLRQGVWAGGQGMQIGSTDSSVVPPPTVVLTMVSFTSHNPDMRR